jgi:hypothetical protein
MAFLSTLKKSRDQIRAQQADPWHVRLEAARGKMGDDGVERIATATLFDILEIPQVRRSPSLPAIGEADAGVRMEPDQGEGFNARWFQGSGEGMGEGEALVGDAVAGAPPSYLARIIPPHHVTTSLRYLRR